MIFLQGDILALPFRPKSFETVISMNVIHILDDARGVLSELDRVRAAGGSLSVSSLVRGRRLGNNYLSLLHRSRSLCSPDQTGGVASPRGAAELLELCAELGIVVSGRVVGNMVFITTRNMP